MIRRLIWLCILLLLLLVGSRSSQPVQAGLWFTQTGVLGKNITVCFVGSAVSQRLDRVKEIVDYIKHFEYAANIHFLTNRLAEFVGSTVIRTTDALSLHSAWKIRGANLAYVAKDFHWRLNGETVSIKAELVMTGLAAGSYTLHFSHGDLLGRQYNYVGEVQVLEPSAHQQLIAAAVGAANERTFVKRRSVRCCGSPPPRRKRWKRWGFPSPSMRLTRQPLRSWQWDCAPVSVC